jgi:hypothetical protein
VERGSENGLLSTSERLILINSHNSSPDLISRFLFEEQRLLIHPGAGYLAAFALQPFAINAETYLLLWLFIVDFF